MQSFCREESAVSIAFSQAQGGETYMFRYLLSKFGSGVLVHPLSSDWEQGVKDYRAGVELVGKELSDRP